ncbi:MAG: hypothetical protein NT013_31350 [Planctomycetia bacterium]|nr:hypothetical protein [Planctomycetia bacterium]
MPLLNPLGRAGAFDFSPHAGAVHAVLREHQQQAVVDLDGPVDFYVAVIAPRDEPSASHRVGKRSARHAER